MSWLTKLFSTSPKKVIGTVEPSCKEENKPYKVKEYLCFYDIRTVFWYETFAKKSIFTGEYMYINDFFDKSLEYAQKQAKMAGLAHITLLEEATCRFKDDPITKVLSDEQKKEIIELTGLKEGQTIFFICDTSASTADKNAGVIRTWLGNELGLIDKDSFEFCFVVDFPMYERDETTDKIIFTHNPFSMPQGGMDALLNKDPLEIFAYQYDIVCNGVELSSGAVRNHNPEIMRKAFEIAGYGEEDLKAKFGALYTAFAYGAPPHAGMAPGIDRMVMLLTDEERKRSLAISRTLFASLEYAKEHTLKETKAYVEDSINAVDGFRLEYYQIVDGYSLQPVEEWSDCDYIVGCIALFCGKIRLIDNIKYKEVK